MLCAEVALLNTLNYLGDFVKGMTETLKKKVLLHSCCGPCSTACIERLLPEYNVTIFFYNPNITEKEEYERRKEAQKLFIQEFNKKNSPLDEVKYIEGEYLPEEYFDICSGLENCKEGGARCTECFKLRLKRTAKEAKNLGINMFGTTLTVSPHKNYQLISTIGNDYANEFGLEFLDIDFKKQDGFKRSIELSKEYSLYRQDYCGCKYSKWHD